MTATERDCPDCDRIGGCAWHTVSVDELAEEGFLPPLSDAGGPT
jgi:hypothetical protein